LQASLAGRISPKGVIRHEFVSIADDVSDYSKNRTAFVIKKREKRRHPDECRDRRGGILPPENDAKHRSNSILLPLREKVSFATQTTDEG
jgi:hypothetical protein